MGDAGASSVHVSGEAQDAGGWGAAVDDPPPPQARTAAEKHPCCAVTVLGVPQPTVGDLPAGSAGQQIRGRGDQVRDALLPLATGGRRAGTRCSPRPDQGCGQFRDRGRVRALRVELPQQAGR
jgi:hypothetical protein